MEKTAALGSVLAAGETDPPGYTQASIATIRVWKSAPTFIPIRRDSMVKKMILSFLVLLCVAVAAWAQSAAPVPVTVDNFIRAESDRYFEAIIKTDGFGKIAHNRGLASINQQDVPRPNHWIRDRIDDMELEPDWNRAASITPI